jgi:hypothetical protein
MNGHVAHRWALMSRVSGVRSLESRQVRGDMDIMRLRRQLVLTPVLSAVIVLVHI